MPRKSLTGFDSNNQRHINVGDPSANTDGVNKQYVDNLIGGLSNKRAVRVKTTGNVNLSSALAAGQTIDGKTLVAGDRVFVGSQTSGQDNGIYVAPSSGAASRSSDFDAGTEIPGALIIVSEGTVNGDTMWLETTDGPITVGTTVLAFTSFTIGVTYTADGNGIELSGNQFSIELDGTTLTKSASGLRIGSGAAGDGLTEASGMLAVNPGNGLAISSDAVVIDTAIVTRKFSASCVATTNPQDFTHNLGTKDVTVVIRDVAGDVLLDADVSTSGTNKVTVDFGGNPTAAQYRVTVFA